MKTTRLRALHCFLWLLAAMSSLACGVQDDGQPVETLGQAEEALTCRVIYPVVVVTYPDGSEFENFENNDVFSPPVRFRLPEYLEQGGWWYPLTDPGYSITLTFQNGATADSCVYSHGGNGNLGPPICDSGAEHGDLVETSWVRSYRNGDPNPGDPARIYAAMATEEQPCLGACDADDGIACTLDFCDDLGQPVHSECLDVAPHEATTMADAVRILTEGATPPQNPAPDHIDPMRAAAIIGHVRAPNGEPLVNAHVTVLGDDDLGFTRTDIEGRFVMAVNGGAPLTVHVQADGYLSSQRTVDVEWGTYAHAGTLELIPPDPKSTTVHMGTACPECGDVQVAEGSLVDDESGSRTAVVMFSPQTVANLEFADGSGQPPPNELTIRLTEYTVGPTGEERMPASLPPQTAYTYAVEISADQALQSGATGIALSEPASIFVDNFLGFPVGAVVPVGSYDRVRGMWVPGPNGRIIKIVAEPEGVADIALEPGGPAVDSNTLDQMGLTLQKREELAELYDVEDELMHAELTHFTPVDLNYASQIPAGACIPLACHPADPEFEEELGFDDESCTRSGSIIECTNQMLGETVPVVGTDYSLHYQSNRTHGASDGRRIAFPISGPAFPDGFNAVAIEATLYVAGQALTQSTYCGGVCPTNAIAELLWDGLDAFGRKVHGAQKATIEIAYVYPAVYAGESSDIGSILRNFGTFGGVDAFVDVDARGVTKLVRRRTVTLGNWENESHALGGWSVDAVHYYDTVSGHMYRGDGTRSKVKSLSTVKVLRGSSSSLQQIYAATTLSDGSLVFSINGSQVWRRSADGASEVVIAAHDGSTSCPGTAVQLATESCLIDGINALVEGPDGLIYARALGGPRVITIDPGGYARLVAGRTTNVSQGAAGDNIPALGAEIPLGPMAFAPDGSLYIAGSVPSPVAVNGAPAIRRIDASGRINTVAGDPQGDRADGTHARRFRFLGAMRGLAFGPGGALYVALENSTDNLQIYRIEADGRVRRIAGADDVPSTSEDDSGLDVEDPATQLRLTRTNGIVVDRAGVLYLDQLYPEDGPNQINGIREITPEGRVRWIAGTSACNPGGGAACGLGGPAINANLGERILNLHLAPDGSLRAHNWWAALVSGAGASWIYAIGPDRQPSSSTAFSVPEEDGSVLYRFDELGRHRETVDTETGAVLLAADYDNDGRLTSIRDVQATLPDGTHQGPLTLIERDTEGVPTGILGHYGHRTGLGLQQGQLVEIIDPALETWNASYDGAGLMQSWTDRSSNTTNFSWSDGRLVYHQNPLGGVMTFQRTNLSTGREVVETNSGKQTKYRVVSAPDGTETRTTTDHNGIASIVVTTRKGEKTLNLPNGAVVWQREVSDQRWGDEAPLKDKTIVALPESTLRKIVEVDETFTGVSELDKLSFGTRTNILRVNGREWSSVYDQTARTETMTSPMQRAAGVTTFDEHGRVILIEAPGVLPVNFHYDNGRLDHAWQGNRHEYFSYHSDGLLRTYTDQLGRVTTVDRDANGRVRSVTRPDLEVVQYSYDPEGVLTSVTTAAGAAHGFTVNAIGATGSYTPPPADGGPQESVFEYNPDKSLDTVLLPDARALAYEYDASGRPDHLWFKGNDTFGPTGEPHGDVWWAYDPDSGELVDASGPTGISLVYDYDGAWLEAVHYGPSAGPIRGTVEWTPDIVPGTSGTQSNFRVATETVNGAWLAQYSYDDDSLLTSAGPLVFDRDPATGRVLSTTAGNVTEEYELNEYGELKWKATKYDGTTYAEFRYAYDQRGRIEAINEILPSAQLTTYGYDELDRLTSVTIDGQLVESYDYDDNGNRRTVDQPSGTLIGTFDAQDRLLGIDGRTYSYYDSGHLSEIEDPSDNSVTQYQYDSFGNLRAVWRSDWQHWITYEVDAEGRRVGKVIDGSLVSAWLWADDLRPVAELDGGGDVIKRFIYAGGANSPELMVTADGTYRLVKDHLGSVRQVIDIATGGVAQELYYDTWGRVLHDSEPGFQPFGFAGGFYDFETGLVRFGARDYDARDGRWLAKDPIGLSGGLNLYEYAASQPVGMVDWTGNDPGRMSHSDDVRAAWGDFPAPGMAELCSGVPQTSALRSAGVRHYWLRTGESNGGLWGGGMWNPQFAPAPDDWAQENYPGFTCEPLPDVEPACVNDVLEDVLGTRQGYPWVPLLSDCQNFAAATIVQCGGDPADLPFGPSAHYWVTHADPGDRRP